MKKIFSMLLIMSFLAVPVQPVYADPADSSVIEEHSALNYIEEKGLEGLNGAPSGVVFGPETYAYGSYEIQGVIISVAAGAISIAIKLPELYSAIVLVISTAMSVGASHVYWTKRIAYGEDANYYYTRTKVRFYSNPARTNPLSDWKIVYHKKSKNSGASTGEIQ